MLIMRGRYFPILGLPAPESADDVVAAAVNNPSPMVSLPCAPLMHGTGLWLGCFIPHLIGSHVVTLTNRSLDEQLIARVNYSGIKLLWASRHINKLKRGHLFGNRFVIHQGAAGGAKCLFGAVSGGPAAGAQGRPSRPRSVQGRLGLN